MSEDRKKEITKWKRAVRRCFGAWLIDQSTMQRKCVPTHFLSSSARTHSFDRLLCLPVYRYCFHSVHTSIHTLLFSIFDVSGPGCDTNNDGNGCCTHRCVNGLDRSLNRAPRRPSVPQQQTHIGSLHRLSSIVNLAMSCRSEEIYFQSQ